MNSWQRLVFYLVLNVLVSACTILTILFLWDRAHQPADLKGAGNLSATLPAAILATPTSEPSPLPPTPLTGEPPDLIRIDNVYGVGNLKDEVVALKRVGEGELDLTGWKLTGGRGGDFAFPALTLFKDGSVQVHTGAGVNTVVDLYWGRDAPAWQVGDTAKLVDEQGRLWATFKIP